MATTTTSSCDHSIYWDVDEVPLPDLRAVDFLPGPPSGTCGGEGAAQRRTTGPTGPTTLDGAVLRCLPPARATRLDWEYRMPRLRRNRGRCGR